jgi:hypothetical protein
MLEVTLAKYSMTDLDKVLLAGLWVDDATVKMPKISEVTLNLYGTDCGFVNALLYHY